jgi:D-alanyl-D-alanine carboxypeptidase
VTDILSRARECIQHAWSALLAALFVALLASGVLAAPYADYVIDARTGQVLHETNADTRLHPASLTKMMTLYIAFEAIEHGEISLDTKVTISKHAAAQPPSRLGLRAGQQIALRHLIRAAAIKSANDAATAIGEAIEGTESAFAKRMTRTAKAMGMSKTTFRNANGLTAEGHLSTAHDMTILGRRLFFDYPQYYGIFSRRTADAGIAQVASTNRRFLDAYEGADGIKTGYTVAAGFNLVASAERGNKRIIATVFGGKSTATRNARVAELLDLGFGKAPKKAKVAPPPLLAYNGETADPEEDVIAETIAANVDPNVPAAGKVLRLNTAVKDSPIPKARPTAGAVALAAAEPLQTAPDTDALIVAEAADMADATDALMASMSDTIEAALAEAIETPAFEQTTAPQPETAALAATETLTDQSVNGAAAHQTDADAPAAVLAAVATPDPFASATTLAPTAAAMPPGRAAIAPEIAGEVPTVTETVVVAAPEPPSAPPEPAEDEFVLAGLPAPSLPEPRTQVIAASVAASTPIALSDPGLAEAIVLTPASLTVDGATEPAAEPEGTTSSPQIVTRVSTSGGREWGINIGSFPSRYNAERELLRTALVEMATLDEALRKVASRKGAFDANFVGMTEEEALLACKRLAARGTDCKVLSPAG